MIDIFGYPLSKKNGNVSVFTRVGDGTNSWQQWEKPKGCTLIHIFAVGGGGGGGAGFTGTAGTQRGGGGGGGPAAIQVLTIPAWAVTDNLFIRVGAGGAGGPSSGSNGSAGGASTVSMSNNLGTAPVYLTSGDIAILAQASGGSVGNAGSGSAGGTRGALPSSYSSSHYALPFNIVNLASTVGMPLGTAGGDSGSPSDISPNYILSGGAGGAGTLNSDAIGGASAGSGTLARYGTIKGGNNASDKNGQNGITLFEPFMSCGGCGGAGVNSGAGGNGGKGGIGSGGGGGGGGTTGGAGGAGGDGIVIITVS